jgi:dolichyl-phosphate-mannose-protein mannosyltransferase
MTTSPLSASPAAVLRRSGWKILAVALLLFMALYNLTKYPVTWFDEGSHLHVPKTLLHLGVYADYSSDGFRYYGPTIGVGPTVLLPIAGAFKLFGIGLLQARLVIVLYLLATVFVFFRLARGLGGARLAWVATALLVASNGVALVEYGREVLGEVPGFFFMAAGLWVWFTSWEKADWRRLGLAGLLFGLATITKNQYLLVLVPALGLAWLTNLVYYRSAPQRAFIVPGLIAIACYAVWQGVLILSLGPATAQENLASLREATAGAALVFSPSLMQRSIGELLSIKVYLGLLGPALIYGFVLALPRRREGQLWSILLSFVAANLVWYVVASISWLRYAFPGLVLGSLFVARLFADLTNGFQLNAGALWEALRRGTLAPREALNALWLVWLAALVVLPAAQVVKSIVRPDFDAPVAMAAYMNAHVPKAAVVETWEPEMGFLTDHNYHFPPPQMLNKAIGYIWLDQPFPWKSYQEFVQTELPDYVLLGGFANWVGLYPYDWLRAHYQLETTIGGYALYALKK